MKPRAASSFAYGLRRVIVSGVTRIEQTILGSSTNTKRIDTEPEGMIALERYLAVNLRGNEVALISQLMAVWLTGEDQRRL